MEVVNKKTNEKKTVQLLRRKDVEDWLKCKDISLNQEQFRELLIKVGVPAESISAAAFAEQFRKRGTSEFLHQKEFKAKQIIAFIQKKCGADDAEIPGRVEMEIDARMEHATLRVANGPNGQPGQKILTVPVKQATQQFYGPHFNPTALAKHPTAVAGFKNVDNSNSVVYLRKEIWVGQKLKKKGKRPCLKSTTNRD